MSLVASAAPASAEWALDLYGGGAFTQRANVDLFIPQFGATSAERVRFDVSYDVGVRGIYWLTWLPSFGVALDAHYFRHEVSRQLVPVANITTEITGPDFETIATSLLAMWRWEALKDAEHPRGRLQPYLLVGPTMFITKLKPAGGGLADATAHTLGITAGGGLSMPITQHLALFGEYRFTHQEPGFDLKGLATPVRVEAEFNTHHLLVGVSLRW